MALSHKQIMDGVYHINDGGNNYCTLLVGREQAILYDTLMGFDDLRSYVAALTELEPIVINSHCHRDHLGGNYQFDRIYMGAEEFPLIETGLAILPILEQTLNKDFSNVKRSMIRQAQAKPIQPGTVIDLGGMTVEVIALPGHTPGSLGLLCRERRLLLVGDAVSPQMCLFFPESLPPEEYGRTLSGLWDLPFDSFLAAHFGILFPKDILTQFAQCLSMVGEKRGVSYVYSPLPHLKGRAYVLQTKHPEIGEPICVIVKKPSQNDPAETKPPHS